MICKSQHWYIIISYSLLYIVYHFSHPKQDKYLHQNFLIFCWLLYGFHICESASTSFSAYEPGLDNLHIHKKTPLDTNSEADLAERNHCFLPSMEQCTKFMPTTNYLCVWPLLYLVNYRFWRSLFHFLIFLSQFILWHSCVTNEAKEICFVTFTLHCMYCIVSNYFFLLEVIFPSIEDSSQTITFTIDNSKTNKIKCTQSFKIRHFLLLFFQ
jgi:hypothetical protein